MTILHANTDPDLLTRLRQMMGSAVRADIAVGYFFMSGFGQVAEDLARLRNTRTVPAVDDYPDSTEGMQSITVSGTGTHTTTINGSINDGNDADYIGVIIPPGSYRLTADFIAPVLYPRVRIDLYSAEIDSYTSLPFNGRATYQFQVPGMT